MFGFGLRLFSAVFGLVSQPAARGPWVGYFWFSQVVSLKEAKFVQSGPLDCGTICWKSGRHFTVLLTTTLNVCCSAVKHLEILAMKSCDTYINNIIPLLIDVQYTP